MEYSLYIGEYNMNATCYLVHRCRGRIIMKGIFSVFVVRILDTWTALNGFYEINGCIWCTILKRLPNRRKLGVI